METITPENKRKGNSRDELEGRNREKIIVLDRNNFLESNKYKLNRISSARCEVMRDELLRKTESNQDEDSEV